jgi:MFS family permease
VVGDRVDKRRLIVVFLAIQAGAVVVLAFTHTYWMAVGFGVLWGLGYGGRVPLLHALRGDYFGRKSFATVLGINNLVTSTGSVAAPVLVGLVFDLTGTYTWAFLPLAIACLFGCVAILLATPPKTPAAASAV